MSRVLSELRCESCGSAIRRDDLQLEYGVALCSICNNVLVLKVEPVSRPRGRYPRPLDFRVEDQRISWRLIRWSQAATLLFAACWASFWPSPSPLIYVFAACVSYPALVGLMNRVEVTVEGRTLLVRQGPLPWRWPVVLEASALRQLFCVDQTRRTAKGAVRPKFTVKALFKDGSERVVVTDLDEPGQAHYLEQELERMLDLADAEVRGELPRDT